MTFVITGYWQRADRATAVDMSDSISYRRRLRVDIRGTSPTYIGHDRPAV